MTIDHDAIAARVRQNREAGTPGPWKCGKNNLARVSREGRYIADFDPLHSNAPKCETDAARAAFLPDLEAAYLDLHDEVKRLRAERDEALERETIAANAAVGYLERAEKAEAERDDWMRAFAEAPVVWHTGKAIGEVIGELKKVDDLDADNEVVLVPATGPDFIRCTFPEAMKTEIGKFLFKKVKVKGILTYDSLSPHPKKVQILDGGISLYPDSASVVKFADLRGIFADRAVAIWSA